MRCILKIESFINQPRAVCVRVCARGRGPGVRGARAGTTQAEVWWCLAKNHPLTRSLAPVPLTLSLLPLSPSRQHAPHSTTALRTTHARLPIDGLPPGRRMPAGSGRPPQPGRRGRGKKKRKRAAHPELRRALPRARAPAPTPAAPHIGAGGLPPVKTCQSKPFWQATARRDSRPPRKSGRERERERERRRLRPTRFFFPLPQPSPFSLSLSPSTGGQDRGRHPGAALRGSRRRGLRVRGRPP